MPDADDLFINYTTLATSESPIGDTPVSAADTITRYLPQIRRHLSKQGFQHASPLSDAQGLLRRIVDRRRSMRLAAAQLAAPVLQATHSGETVYILLPEFLTSYLDMQSISREQAAFCERHLGKAKVYYAALLHWDIKEGSRISMTDCHLIRKGGEWLQEPDSSQFLPFPLRNGATFGDAIFGPASLGKYAYMMRLALHNGTATNLYVKGLFTSDDVEDGGPVLLHPRGCCNFHTQIKVEDETAILQNTWFYFENPITTDLEILEVYPGKEAAEDGLLCLMDSSGTTFCAACMESAAMRSRFATGQRLRGNLNLVATRLENTGQTISIKEGSFFELEKQRYREEHGCEPPDDYAVHISTMKMRVFKGEEEEPSALATGIVQTVEEEDFEFTTLTHITLRCMPDNDDFTLNVFVRKEILGDYSPQPGDNITCSGRLDFVCTERVETDDAWVDSADVALGQQRELNNIKATQAFEFYKDYSLALAAVAEAITSIGWELESSHCVHYKRNYCSFVARKGNGHHVVICVDEEMNGHAPQKAYTPEMVEKFRSIYAQHFKDEDVEALHCYVKLDYNEKAGGFHVSCTATPDVSPELNPPTFVNIHWNGTILCINDGVTSHKRNYPEVLDEGKMARLYAEAMASSDWAGIAKWMRDDMHYKSATVDVEFHSKLDFLRYISERVENWRHSGMWGDFSLRTGSIPHQGKQRPCCAFCLMGNITACAVFDNRDGLIGSMEVLPRSEYPHFVSDGSDEIKAKVDESPADGDDDE